MEIKFRIWDEESKKLYMQDDFILTFDKVGEDVFLNIKDEIIPLYDYELMQYTGIKDCNGKEIYEDDIVKVKERMAGEDLIGKVIYDETEGCYWIVQGYEGNCFKTIFDLDYEHYVIGNIYENKELLEG